MIEIAICIQIRDGSTRLPGKCSKKLAGIETYLRMIENVNRCVNFINKHTEKKNIKATLNLLVPYDEYKTWCLRVVGQNIKVFCGEQDKNNDVLFRFKKLFKAIKPNYIVRLTGDCPLIPSALINKAINCAVNHRLDYISNVDERVRTMPDGYDVEVVSDECFLWLSERNVSASDKEHVTTHIRANIQPWMRVATITGSMDESDRKLSIDTDKDFEDIETRLKQKITKDKLAKNMGFGLYEF